MTSRLFAMFLFLLAPAAAEKPVARWMYDLDKALAEAERSARPVLVYVLDSV